MSPSEDFSCREVFEVFVVSDDIDWIAGAFQIMSPGLECFKNGQEFFVVCVIVQLCSMKRTRVKCNQMNLIVRRNDRKDSSNSIVRSISFDNEWSIRFPMSKNWSISESEFEFIESVLACS